VSRAPTHRWADWDLSAWCPVLSPVPQIEGTIPSDPEAQAAQLIHRMRAEFFGQRMPVSCESPRGANNPPDLQGFEYFGGNPHSVLRARFIFAELATITRDALWAAPRFEQSGSDSLLAIGLAHAMQTASGPQAATPRGDVTDAITRATRRAMDFARTHAELHSEPPPFGGLPDPEPAEVVALAAIFDAADALHDMLRGVADRERTLAKATLLAGFAIELRDAARLAAQAPAVQRVEKTNKRAKGPRAKRAPGLDSWLDEQIKTDPRAKNETLWAMLKAGAMEDAEIKDADPEGERLDYGRADGRKQTMRRKQFDSRCTEARKRLGITAGRGRKPTIPR
jgi:hypothetical protein